MGEGKAALETEALRWPTCFCCGVPDPDFDMLAMGSMTHSLVSGKLWYYVLSIDVRTPWPSAFLDWIVQTRRHNGKKSSLLRCGEA